MRAFKKYPNRRLYDIQESRYVTIEDVRRVVLKGETISVTDSKSDKDLTRTVLWQIFAEQEGEGHEPILTNHVLEQLVRFYGAPTQGIMSRYIEQSIMAFLDYEQQYRHRVRDLERAEPLPMLEKALDQTLQSRLVKALMPR